MDSLITTKAALYICEGHLRTFTWPAVRLKVGGIQDLEESDIDTPLPYFLD